MSYKSGIEAAKAAAPKGGSGRKNANNIYWKNDGDEFVLRFLTDDVLTVGSHEFVPCNDGKKRDFVCASELAEPRLCFICSDVKVEKFGTGELIPAKPRQMTLGLVALREENSTTGEVTDVLNGAPVKLLVDGKEKEYDDVPVIGVIKQTMTFWKNVFGYYPRYKTLMDRDFSVVRDGKGKDTTYVVTPLDFDETMGVQKNAEKSAAILAEHYALALSAHPSLVDHIEKLGSQERYDYYFGDKPVETEVVESGGEPPFDKDFSDEVSEEKSAASTSSLESKLLKHRK